MALAIIADALAFGVWNISARPPAQLARDLANGIRHVSTALRGIAAFLGGLVFLAAGLLVLERFPIDVHALVILETWTALTGLLVEALLRGGRSRA